MFIVDQEYSKNDIYKILEVPQQSQKGSWDTGYRSYNDEIFIFANIRTAGRTGVDHGNYWENESLVWFGKSTSHPKQELIRKMISNEVNVHLFTRDDSIKRFTYKGIGEPTTIEGNRPVKIIWELINPHKKPSEQKYGIDGIDEVYNIYKEGSRRKTEVSLYKRSKEARKKCIDIKGCVCQVCGFNFEEKYGKIGIGYIHIHHLKEISKIEEEYVIDPFSDLEPVCPNCHAMLHKKEPAYTIEELKDILKENCV